MSVILNTLNVPGNHSTTQNLSEAIPAEVDEDIKVETIASKSITFSSFVSDAKKFASANKIRILQACAALTVFVTAIAIQKYVGSGTVKPINDITGNDAVNNETHLINPVLPIKDQVEGLVSTLSLEEKLQLYFDSKNFTLPNASALHHEETLSNTDVGLLQLTKAGVAAMSDKISTDLNDHFVKVSALNAETMNNLANLATKASDTIASCSYTVISKGSDLKDAVFAGTSSLAWGAIIKVGKLLEPPKFQSLETHGNFAGLKDPVKEPLKGKGKVKAKKIENKPFMFASDHRYHKPSGKGQR